MSPKALFVLILISACAGRSAARTVVYALDRVDGCGACATVATYLVFMAEEIDAEAGGLISKPEKKISRQKRRWKAEHQAHGQNCQAVLKGLGLPAIVSKEEVPDNCLRIDDSVRDVRYHEDDLRRALAAASEKLRGEGCIEIVENFITVSNSTTLAPRAALRKRYATAQQSPFALPPSSIQRSDRVVVAMHIRRGDVSERDALRATPNSWYEHMARALPGYLRGGPSKGQPLDIHVYSEGRPDQFQGLAELATLHLGGNILQVISDMISADVLVTAKSGFSYMPAFFCEGIVLYQRFWHVPAPHWRDASELDKLPEAASAEPGGRP